MAEPWKDLDEQLKLHSPELHARLRPGVSPKAITNAEASIGLSLPEDLRQLYLWHDGCVDGTEDWGDLGPPLFEPFCHWCSLQFMVELWHRDKENFADMLDPSPYFYLDEDGSWSELDIRPWVAPPPQWLCVGYSGTRSRAYVDLLPGPKGVAGQLIYSDGEGSRHVLAPSCSAYLSALAQGMRSGKISYARGHWRGL